MNDSDCDAFLARHLEPGESFLWSGRPTPLVPMSPGARKLLFAMVPVLIGAALAGSVLLLATADDLPDVANGFFAFGVPIFSLFGLWLWLGALQGARECYGLTQKRVLLRAATFRSKCVSVDLLDIQEVRLHGPGAVELVTLPRSFVAGASGQSRYPVSARALPPPEGPVLRVREAGAVRDKIDAARRAVLPPGAR